ATLAAPAAAVPVFGAPVDLSAPGGGATEPQVAFDPSGNALAVWTRSNGTDLIVQARFRPAGGPFDPLPATDLSAAGQSAFTPQVAFDGAGNALAIWSRYSAPNSASVVQAASRPPGGGFGAPVDLSLTEADQSQVAFDGAGNALAVWARFNGSNEIVEGAFRPAGGSFAPLGNLSVTGQDAFDPQVAFDGAGTAIVVWTRSNGTNDIVQAAFRPAGGNFGTPMDLSAAGEDAGEPQVASASDGHAIVVWTRSNGTNDIVQAAFRAPGSNFATRTNLSAAGRNAGQPQVAYDGSGNALAIWRRSNGTNNIVQAASRPAGSVFGAGVDLSGAGGSAIEPQVAFDGDGNALAVWRRFNGANGIVQAAFRPAGGSFTALPDLSAAGATAATPQVAFDPSGNALAVWTRLSGTNIVQAAFGPPFVPGASPGNGPGPGTAPADTTSPSFTGKAKAKPSKFQVDRKGKKETAVKAAAKGTKFKYSLSEAATVTFAIERRTSGRKLKGKCLKKTRSSAKRRRCARFKRVGAFRAQSNAGPNGKRFSGRIGKRTLKPGSYRALLTAVDAAGNESRPAKVAFKVVRAKRGARR
ncbi:MAG: hypothetical protein WBV53_04875, partial [Solirubrobacterales bacterium]